MHKVVWVVREEGLVEMEAAAIFRLAVLGWVQAVDQVAITLIPPTLSAQDMGHSEQWEVRQARQAHRIIIKAKPLPEMFMETAFSFR